MIPSRDAGVLAFWTKQTKITKIDDDGRLFLSLTLDSSHMLTLVVSV